MFSSEMNRLIIGAGQTESAYYFVMATAYYCGSTVHSDFKRALAYFHNAILCGNTVAYLYLGRIYRISLGIEQDKEKVFILFKRGAHHRDVECLSILSGPLSRLRMGCGKRYGKRDSTSAFNSFVFGEA